VAEAYLLDEAMTEFFEQSNPWARRDIAERLMEAMQRGMWREPDSETKGPHRGCLPRRRGATSKAVRIRGRAASTDGGSDRAAKGPQEERDSSESEAYRQEVRKAKRRKGLVVVNTGTGKGKTTAAFRIAFRVQDRRHERGALQFIKPGSWRHPSSVRGGAQTSRSSAARRACGAASRPSAGHPLAFLRIAENRPEDTRARLADGSEPCWRHSNGHDRRSVKR